LTIIDGDSSAYRKNYQELDEGKTQFSLHANPRKPGLNFFSPFDRSIIDAIVGLFDIDVNFVFS